MTEIAVLRDGTEVDVTPQDLGYGRGPDREFEAELRAFYTDLPTRRYRSFPYQTIHRPVARAFRAGRLSLTWYERSPGRCLLIHNPEVVADYWVEFTLGRRLECRCGKVALIEVYG